MDRLFLSCAEGIFAADVIRCDIDVGEFALSRRVFLETSKNRRADNVADARLRDHTVLRVRQHE